MDLKKNPKFQGLIQALEKSVVEIADELPCEECKQLRDELNAAKSKAKTHETKSDDLQKQIEEGRLTKETVRILCGDQFPEDPAGFSFEACDHWKIELGRLVPFAGGSEAPGPDFKVRISIDPT